MTQQRLMKANWPSCALRTLFWVALACAVRATSADERETFFESKVRPVLVARCVECHGADEQNADLRLDQNPLTEASQVVVPGKPTESKLVHAIRYEESSAAMPPDRKLPDQEIKILTDWIEAGAYWPKQQPGPSTAPMLPPAKRIDQIRDEHWAFKPVGQLTPPDVSRADWVKQPIDRFLLNKLEEKGLSPSKPADKRTLILRAHFILTGLPPTYEEVEAFVADNTPEAFSQLIDRLLQSRHYGERWARHWLDIARFAETTGYLAGSVDTTYPYAYTFRDYVINAFNDDKPYDRFVMEQIAADRMELIEDEQSALAALGFLTVGRKFMGNSHDIIDDRIDVVSRGFLGLSVTCARCHDHKYDPIPTADYYSLYGVFSSSSEPSELPLLGRPEDNPQYAEFVAARQQKEREVENWLDKKRIQTEKELRSRVADYLEYLAKTRPGSGHSDVKPLGQRGALRPPATSRWKRFLTDGTNSNHPVWMLWIRLAELPAEDFKAKSQELLSEQSSATWLAGVHQGLLTTLRAEPPETMEAVAKIMGQQLEAAEAAWLAAVEKDQSLTRLPDDSQEQLRSALYAEGAPTVLDLDRMRTHLDQAERNEYNRQLSKVKAVESKHPGAPARAMAINDNPNPRNAAIFLRGQPGNRGDEVPRRFLQVLSHVDGGQPFSDGSGRLELARAIASPNNPLTARVIVNRVWQQHFGFGLVRTPSDFGARGEQPTHPDLLDYLAAEFMADAWSIKRLQRRIMLSAAWQQSSEHRAEGQAIDPENRLLWHMPRRRLEFEPLRDRWLMVSGNLDLQIGGRSVKIHEDATRRGLYAYLDREDVPSLLAAFDVPSPDASQASRSRTTVPQQALYMINSKFVIEQAKLLAAKTAEVADTQQRIIEYYRHCLARDPKTAEIELAKQFLDPSKPPLPGSESNAEFEGDSSPGFAKTKEPLDPWVQFAQVLLVSNEFAFVD
jgi:cytochrome c553